MGSPAFATIPRAVLALVQVANPNRADAGTIVTAFSAGAQGSKIERIVIKALVTTTAGMIRLWLNNGGGNALMLERPVPAITVSATVAAWEDEVDFSPPDKLCLLPSGWSLRASTEKAESFNIHVFGADYPPAS
jgi:hypothetical protein